MMPPQFGAPGTATVPTAYGGFWRRVAAYVIDSLLLTVVLVLIGVVIGLGVAVFAPGADIDGAEPLFNIISILVFWLYFANLECGPKQATIGKRALGLRVCDAKGQPLSFGRASGRFFAKILSGLILGVGFLMVGFTARKQGLHDIVAETLVVRTGE